MRRLLLIGMTAIGLLAIGATAWQAYANARTSIEAATYERLTSLRESKRREVLKYLEGCRDQAALLAQAPGIRLALAEMDRTFTGLAPGQDDAAALRRFYEEQFLPKLVNGGERRPVEEFLPTDSQAVAAQALFIARNDFPIGEKDRLVEPANGGAYAAAHAAHHDVCRAIIRTFGFYDLFLINPDGRIVYSVFKEVDFGTSLASGPHRDSNLADAFRLAREASADAIIVDFQRYAPSYQAPGAFIAAPVRSPDGLLGVLAVQLPVDRINRVMTGDGAWSDDGLGASGETYLVGPDEYMRSDSRFIIESPDRFLARLRADPNAENVERIDAYRTTILFQRVATDASRAAIRGESGAQVVMDYRGLPVLSAYAPLNLPGIQWAILSEIDAEEAFAPVRSLAVRVASLSGIVALLFVAFAAGLSLMLARNEAMADARAKIENDLAVARGIQQGLLPHTIPDIPGFDIAGWSEPADETGGDYFDWQRVSNGRLAVSLADVTGHGIGPALVTAVCRAYARASFADAADLGPVMARINALLHEDLPQGRFITFVVGLLDAAAHHVELLSAGHAPICIYRAATGEVILREADEMPFGIVRSLPFSEANVIDLEPGDMLVLVTDGFFEWANPEKELFGIERLRASITAAADRSAAEIIAALYHDVLDFAQGTPQLDDLTAIVIKRNA